MRPRSSTLSNRFAVIAAAACVVMAAGCSTLQLPDYPAHGAADYQYRTTGKELSLAVHPLVTRSEVKKYFGTNLLRMGILPVHFVVENHSATSSFVVADEDFALRGFEKAPGRVIARDAKRQVDRSGIMPDPTGVGMGVVMILSPALHLVTVFPAMDAMSNKAEIKRNFVTKQYRIKTISPRESASGFVYFQLPEKKQSPTTWIVHAEIARTGDQEAEQLDVEFNWKR